MEDAYPLQAHQQPTQLQREYMEHISLQEQLTATSTGYDLTRSPKALSSSVHFYVTLFLVFSVVSLSNVFRKDCK